MKSQHTTNHTNKRPLEFPSMGSMGPSYSGSSKDVMNMKGSNISPPDTFLYQDDPHLQNFNQHKYDADSYDTFAMPENYPEPNLSQGLPKHMMYPPTYTQEGQQIEARRYP